MNNSVSENRGRLMLFGAVLLVTLIAGLKPEEYNFRNNVEWVADGNGIEFAVFGVAYSKPFVSEEISTRFARDGFTLEIALSGLGQKQNSFAFIAQFYSGDDGTQLVLGQWSDHLIVMNGDDYEHRIRTPRISLKLPPTSDGNHLVCIASGPEGTRLYLDGRLVAEKPDLRLTFPSSPEEGRLVLGNSAYGINPWKGTVRGMALYAQTFGEEAVADQFSSWQSTGTLAGAEGSETELIYTFDSKRGRIAEDRSGNGIDLQFPNSSVILRKQFLEAPFQKLVFNTDFARDVIVNFFGFIPFGLSLSFVLYGFGIGGIRNVVIVVVASAGASFGIELVQVWLPSRTSSLLDLVLNILGGLAAASGLTRLVGSTKK